LQSTPVNGLSSLVQLPTRPLHSFPTRRSSDLTVLTQPDPFPPSKLSVFIFQDDFPLNGEQDGGGGLDVLSQNEPGLGGFNIVLLDRKSTRLNSSHLGISYAVFCLKKKKNNLKM